MGVTFPFCATMFILVGGLAAQGVMQPDEIVLPLTFAGLWCLGYRLVLSYYLVRHDSIQPIAPEHRIPFGRSLRTGWTSLLLFVPILIPLLLTRGPIAAALGELLRRRRGAQEPGQAGRRHRAGPLPYAMPDVISLITWIPVLMIALVLFLGRKHLPHTPTAWWHTLGKAAPSFGVIGITIIAAFSASNVLAELGLAEQLEGVLASLHAPAWIMAIAIGVIIVLIAIPLTASATMAAVGPVAVVALVGAGVPAPVAAAAVLIFASTEGASPPSGAPIYVAVGHRPGRPGQDLHPAAQVLLPAHPRHRLPDRRRRAAGLTATSPRRSTDEFDEERVGGGRAHAVPNRTCPDQPVRPDRAVLPARRSGHRDRPGRHAGRR